MDKDNIVSITADGKFELPTKIQRQIKPGDRHKVSITEDSIDISKNKKSNQLSYINYQLFLRWRFA
ncbi:MAG: hypothetical protein F6K17_04895 [Okeania sp. SIO3C4]|nr:hypothetical protein [Okeania sp. SIO3B3]NER02017.1 hypothetical protein [Okeania sp. SIO3C4]